MYDQQNQELMDFDQSSVNSINLKITSFVNLVSQDLTIYSSMIEAIGFPQDNKQFRILLQEKQQEIEEKISSCNSYIYELDLHKFGFMEQKQLKKNLLGYKRMIDKFSILSQLSTKKQQENLPNLKDKSEDFYEKEEKRSLLDNAYDDINFDQNQDILIKKKKKIKFNKNPNSFKKINKKLNQLLG
ncbi:hypothetical protein M0812_07115 [Anaeramoeba flamelloides]|uniref:Uncharacterized protein n=2 Tax=Anaeramoeba flamelloides TaxID=1746091 RepID=A0AAV8ABW4_9EUKA|nr:hypothetical protein M0812_07115 [Anaeramoeba flamelloides]